VYVVSQGGGAGGGAQARPADVARRPVIIGHEFCGEICEVGARWRGLVRPGEKFSVQPALSDPDNVHAAPGYSFPYLGGDATYVILPAVVMERDCLLKYEGDAFFMGSLAEPVSCIVGGFHVNYHTAPGSYEHQMGIRAGGNTALLAGVGPMGLGAIDYALHSDRRPGLLVVTDIDEARLARAAALYPPDEARRQGVELRYLNTKDMPDAPGALRAQTEDGRGFDDVFVYAPVAPVVEQADAILAYDGCLNFFAGPTDSAFAARFNFYNVHYMATHVAGNSGGNTDDMREALAMMAGGRLNPAAMITHVGGLDCVIDTTLRLPEIPGGKKLIYTHLSLPLTAVDEVGRRIDPALGAIVEKYDGLWNPEAEAWLLAHGRPLPGGKEGNA
jgi:threonine dehydrogenase-like Zn-dependent dehydrogenase